MTDAKLKIQPSEVRRYRRTQERLHKLTAKQKKNLLAKPVEVVFSLKFMEIALRKAPQSWKLSAKTCRNIVIALKGTGANIFAEATKLSYQQLDGLPNFGAMAMARYLDMLTAFDLQMPEVPTGPPIPEEFHDEALALAESLGLK